MENSEYLVDAYNYELPHELIASHPASPADASKLLIYDRRTDRITHTTFKHILDFLPQNTSILLNDTKVIKARVFGKKTTGGQVELLMNSPLSEDLFLVYIRGKVKKDTLIIFDEDMICKVVKLRDDGSREVKFYQNEKVLNFLQIIDILERIGHVPLPPYIKREDQKSDERDYQTLFADNYGAVAAPTASLHFTPELYNKMLKKFQSATLTLHVGAGTFKPVDVTDIRDHHMHSETYNVSSNAQDIINGKSPLLAIGTTVTRTVEYYHKTKIAQGKCDLFLHPNNPPKRVNHLLTNFHLPKSTLLMLVASFVGKSKALEIYNLAIEKKYRFFSYGDSMLIV